MTEPTEPIESFLRQSLAAETAPTLSPDFQQQLHQRLQPRRLGKKPRRFLIAYALTGLAVSVGALQLAGFSWWLILLFVLIPLIIVAIVLRPYFMES
jgi:uncharacterized membrane protein YdbT with pleckstrin-like domain